MNFSRLEEGWRFSLVALYADRRAHGLGPGPALPMEMAPDLGLTFEELRTFNDSVLAAVDRMKAHERTIAQVKSGADGDFYSIPAYTSEREAIMNAFRREVTVALAEKSRIVLDLIEASPYLTAGDYGTTVSAALHNGVTGVELSQGTCQIAGPYESDAGEFILSRYGHLINFPAIDRASKK